jgi:hypothetical protein
MEDLQSTSEFVSLALQMQAQEVDQHFQLNQSELLPNLGECGLPMPETDLSRIQDELNLSKLVLGTGQSSRHAIELSEDSQRWTRKDFLNFSIEEVWKEMEEI